MKKATIPILPTGFPALPTFTTPTKQSYPNEKYAGTSTQKFPQPTLTQPTSLLTTVITQNKLLNHDQASCKDTRRAVKYSQNIYFNLITCNYSRQYARNHNL
jgi:hypothetical protein